MSWRYNKDKSGAFTDEAIEAVEQELKTLAEKIQVKEDELGERIADNTFRRSFDFIEEELITMRIVAVDMVHERAMKRVAQVEGNKKPKMLLICTSFAYSGIGILFLLFSMIRMFTLGTTPMNYLVPGLVFSILFAMLMVASMNAQAIDQWLLREIDIDLKLALDINSSAKELLPT